MFELSSLHQKLIHFPIAFLVLYPFVEILGLIKKSEFIDKLSLTFIIIGVIGLLLALITGNHSLNLFNNISKDDLSIIDQHIEYATYSTWFSSALLLLRIYFNNKIKSNYFSRVIIILISLFTLYFVIKTGEYGGLTNEIITNYKKSM